MPDHDPTTAAEPPLVCARHRTGDPGAATCTTCLRVLAEHNRAYARWLTDLTAPEPPHWPGWLARAANARFTDVGRHARAAQACDAALQLEADADAYEAALRLPPACQRVFWDVVVHVGPVAAFIVALTPADHDSI